MDLKTETAPENASPEEAQINTPPLTAGLGDSLPIADEATGIADKESEENSNAPKSEAEAAAPVEGLRDTAVSPSVEEAPALPSSQSESEDAALPAPSADDASGKTEEELPSLPASDASTDEPKGDDDAGFPAPEKPFEADSLPTEEPKPAELDEAAALPGVDEEVPEASASLPPADLSEDGLAISSGASSAPEVLSGSVKGEAAEGQSEEDTKDMPPVAGPDTEAPAVPEQEAAPEPEKLTDMHEEAAPISDAVPNDVTGALKDAGNTLGGALCQLGGFQEEIAKLEGEAAARFSFLRQKATEFVAALEAVFKRG